MFNFGDIEKKIVIICGPTASGKSSLALEMARSLRGVIINADAMQVYKDLPILTAQPSIADMEGQQHKLYSIIGVEAHYSVAIWLELVTKEIEECLRAGKTPIIVGGSGLYIKSLVDGLAVIPDISEDVKKQIQEMLNIMTPREMHDQLATVDQVLGNRLAVHDIKRVSRGLAVYLETKIPLSDWHKNTVPKISRDKFFLLNLDIERRLLYKTCDARFMEMLNLGAMEEVAELLRVKSEIRWPKILGLHELISYIKGELKIDEAISKSQQLTRNYAKRQVTWFNNQMLYDRIIKKGYD